MADDTSSDSADETKRKFREALERKKAGSAGGSAHKDSGNKQSQAHGAVGGGKREFRRKSG